MKIKAGVFLLLFAGCAATKTVKDFPVNHFPLTVEKATTLPAKDQFYIYLMAGQSNMAGRGFVQPGDTLASPRVLALNKNNEWVLAKEPLHYYEPTRTGLDCGLSFGKKLSALYGKEITIGLVPCAIGGSSIEQWLGDLTFHDVVLYSNLMQKAKAAMQYGTIKGILWHQGEADTDPTLIPGYEERLRKIFTQLRLYCDNATLPIVIGELGSFSGNQANWNLINQSIHHYVSKDKQAAVVDTDDLKPKEDMIHFNSEGQRIMGERMAKTFLDLTGN